MAWSVTLKAGLKDVVLPNQQRYQGGAIVILSDEEIGQLSPTAITKLFTGVPVLATATWPAGGV
jgi:hypothetical protein